MEENTQKLPITQWAEDDRPREKMLNKGKGQLSKAELIAILIGSGSRNESAVELSKRILNSTNNNLAELSMLTVTDLEKFKGIGTAKAVSIVAALELGRRRREDDVLENHNKITSSNDAYNFVYSDLSDLKREEFWIILLKRSNSIIKKIRISEGGLSGTVADPKIIFRFALENSASSIILAHNHPSNNLQPSQNDIDLTRKLVDAGKSLEISVLDHLIIGSDKYFSFADESIIKF